MNHHSHPNAAVYDEQQLALLEQMSEEARELQDLIQTGAAWHLEGSVGRACMAAIRKGQCFLGKRRYKDYYGNIVPAYTDIQPGRPGSLEHVSSRMN